MEKFITMIDEYCQELRRISLEVSQKLNDKENEYEALKQSIVKAKDEINSLSTKKDELVLLEKTIETKNKDIIELTEKAEKLTKNIQLTEDQHKAFLAEVEVRSNQAKSDYDMYMKMTEDQRKSDADKAIALAAKDKEIKTREQDVRILENRLMKAREKGQIMFNIGAKEEKI